MTTLDNSYCVPKTAEEWRLLGVSPHSFGGNLDSVIYDDGQTRGRLLSKIRDCYSEIPVQHFLDLFHDRITGWRLEEVGWNRNVTHFKKEGDTEVTDIVWYNLFIKCQSGHHELIFHDGVVRLVNDKLNIKTFTEVLQFVNFLTYPSVS